MDNYLFFADKPLEQYHKSDSGLIACIILLCGLGIFTLSVSSQTYAMRMFGDPLYFVKRQLICMVGGLVGLLLFASLRMSVIRRILPYLVVGAFILCLLTFIPFFSIEKNGARRWINMPFNFSLQPSEFAKFAVILFLANLFDKQAAIVNTEDRSVLPAVIGLGLFVLIIFLQKDFSTGLFIFIVGIIMFFETGMKLFWLLPFSPLAISAVVFMVALEPYRMERIIGFLRPDQNIHTFNYQSLAAKRAISAGGFWGSGIGSGIAWSTKIPEVQADYIFAGWTEAMGVIGVIIYFILLCLFAWRGYHASFMTKNRFAAYGTFGCVTMIFLQSLMNCGVVCGALPTTGIPLPFFSLGGSSIIITLTMCGFILNTSRGDADENASADYVFSDEKVEVSKKKGV
jgi:cell division protein FtsW